MELRLHSLSLRVRPCLFQCSSAPEFFPGFPSSPVAAACFGRWHQLYLHISWVSAHLFWPPQIPVCHLWIKAAKIIFSSRFCPHATPTPHGFLYSSTWNSSTRLWKGHMVVPLPEKLHPFAPPAFLPWSKMPFESPSSQMPACFPGCHAFAFCIKDLLSLQECFCGALQKWNNTVVI